MFAGAQTITATPNRALLAKLSMSPITITSTALVDFRHHYTVCGMYKHTAILVKRTKCIFYVTAYSVSLYLMTRFPFAEIGFSFSDCCHIPQEDIIIYDVCLIFYYPKYYFILSIMHHNSTGFIKFYNYCQANLTTSVMDNTFLNPDKDNCNF